MDLTGTIIAESPIYRGNALKTLFTRDGDGIHRLVSLPGEISGTAQALMDAFIGQSKNRRNQGLFNRGWERLYGQPMPQNLILKVECRLQENSYPKNRFFDMRMGIKLDEDRWAAESNANYKMETVFKNAAFDFKISVNDNTLSQGENRAKLYYILNEMKEGRFWFGAGKTKGLGLLRLDMDISRLEPSEALNLRRGINHLRLDLFFDSMNPVLIGWNWGKKDPDNNAGSQTDTWIDGETRTREDHIRIKKMINKGEIRENDWRNRNRPPGGIDSSAWQEFLSSHSRVKFNYMRNFRNLNKSITNDKNMIDFLSSYREQTQEELHREHHMDFRSGGSSKREVSRKYGKPYDRIFMRMLTWSPSNQQRGTWEIYIPGSTIKGAFRKRASQVLKTLMDQRVASGLIDALFGRQGQRGKIFFSDAYLTDPVDDEKSWCSMDGVRMDPQTGRPYDKSKQDYLFAYGNQLKFKFRMDVQDIRESDEEALSLLFHLLDDFQRGDIPLGGDRNSGFGWVEAKIPQLTWLTSDQDNITKQLFGNRSMTQNGIWQEIKLDEQEVKTVIQPLQKIAGQHSQVNPPRVNGFISHRSFGGHCGMLTVEAEVLTPLSIRESGEPSYTSITNDGPINGWDFFSLSPPASSHKTPERTYALPSRSIKGMLRHIYAIASDSRNESTEIDQLNPVDSLFGWVGSGQNQALAGRVSFSFGLFDNPELAWFEAPYPYGNWQYRGTEWTQIEKANATKTLINNHWRVFPHTPLAPIVQKLPGFEPKGPNAIYVRAVMPGSKARFSVRFWNLLDEELQRLIWCIMLEADLAHKMGMGRYLGFGSVRLKFIAPCYLIDWNKRYTGIPEDKWQAELKVPRIPNVIKHYEALKKELNAGSI